MSSYTAASAATASSSSASWDLDDACTDLHESAPRRVGYENGKADGLHAGYVEGRNLGRITAIDYGTELGFLRGVVETYLQVSAVDREEGEAVVGETASVAAAAAELGADGGGGQQERRQQKPSSSGRTVPPRAERTARKLLAMLDSFPGPEEVFRHHHERREASSPGEGGGHEEEMQGESRAEGEGEDVGDDHQRKKLATSAPVRQHRSSHDSHDGDGGDGANVREKLQRIRAHFKLLTVQIGMPHLSLKNLMDEAAAAAAAAQLETNGKNDNSTTAAAASAAIANVDGDELAGW